MLLGTFLDVSFDAHMLSFLLGINVGVELLSCTVCTPSSSEDTARQFSKVVYLVSLHQSVLEL